MSMAVYGAAANSLDESTYEDRGLLIF
jgi:hypothetical protein